MMVRQFVLDIRQPARRLCARLKTSQLECVFLHSKENKMEAQTYAPFKKVYLFDPVTGIYTGTGNAQLSPLDVPGTYLYPTHSTDTAPPTAAVNQVAVFDRGGWSLKPDYRWQTIYNQTDGSDKLVTAIGSLPDGDRK